MHRQFIPSFVPRPYFLIRLQYCLGCLGPQIYSPYLNEISPGWQAQHKVLRETMRSKTITPFPPPLTPPPGSHPSDPNVCVRVCLHSQQGWPWRVCTVVLSSPSSPHSWWIDTRGFPTEARHSTFSLGHTHTPTSPPPSPSHTASLHVRCVPGRSLFFRVTAASWLWLEASTADPWRLTKELLQDRRCLSSFSVGGGGGLIARPPLASLLGSLCACECVSSCSSSSSSLVCWSSAAVVVYFASLPFCRFFVATNKRLPGASPV